MRWVSSSCVGSSSTSNRCSAAPSAAHGKRACDDSWRIRPMPRRSARPGRRVRRAGATRAVRSSARDRSVTRWAQTLPAPPLSLCASAFSSARSSFADGLPQLLDEARAAGHEGPAQLGHELRVIADERLAAASGPGAVRARAAALAAPPRAAPASRGLPRPCRSRISRSRSGCSGLVRSASMPAARQRSSSSVMALAVSATMGSAAAGALGCGGFRGSPSGRP